MCKQAVRQARALIWVVLASLGPCGAAAAADVRALLKAADGFRLASGEVEVRTQIRLFRSGELDKERLYKVLLKPERRSLVVSESAVEQGQKVLMLADDFWIILPSSQRPVRITPAQKLLGEASAGDIANLTWSEDYDGQVAGEVERSGQACVELDLLARHKGSTDALCFTWHAPTANRWLRSCTSLRTSWPRKPASRWENCAAGGWWWQCAYSTASRPIG